MCLEIWAMLEAKVKHLIRENLHPSREELPAVRAESSCSRSGVGSIFEQKGLLGFSLSQVGGYNALQTDSWRDDP